MIYDLKLTLCVKYSTYFCLVLFPFACLCFPCQAAMVFSLSDSLSEIANPWFGLIPKFSVQVKVYAWSFRSAKD